MDLSEIMYAALALWGAWAEWRAARHKREKKRTADDLGRISAEAERLRREQTLAEQARAARERGKGPP